MQDIQFSCHGSSHICYYLFVCDYTLLWLFLLPLIKFYTHKYNFYGEKHKLLGKADVPKISNNYLAPIQNEH